MFKNKDYILAVYREGSFTRAAEKTFVSQPSLSATVKRVEERLGLPIFDRSSNPVGLTDVGREYVRCAMEIERMEEDFEHYLSERRGMMAGRIRIGGSSFFSAFVLPHIISDFKQSYAGIDFEIFEDSTRNLMAKLASGDLDLVIDNAIVTDENIVSERYKTERLLLAVPRGFAVNGELSRFSLSAADIKADKHLTAPIAPIYEFREEPFILLNKENDTGERADALFKSLGITPRVLFRLDQQVSAYNISSSGMGISFVSDTLVKYMGASSEVLYYNLPYPTSERSIYFYRKKNHYQSLASQRFVEYSTEK